MIEYLRDPAEIYRRSFAAIRSEADLARLPVPLEPVVVRLIHACGMSDIVADLAFSPDLVERAQAALKAGAPVLCDTRMVADGIQHAPAWGWKPGDRAARCRRGSTACARAAHHARRRRDRARASASSGALVAIGNAPTALFRLLELLAEGAAAPAAILAFPVGFVGAAESKAALAASSHGVPYLTLLGRRGGSALAAAAVNALAMPEAGA